MRCSDEDIEQQIRIGNAAAAWLGGCYHNIIDKFSRYEGYVYDVRSRDVLAFLECKNRPKVWVYDPIFVSYRKWSDLMVLSRRVPSLFVLADGDDIRAWQVCDNTFPIQHRGRVERGLQNDMEAILMVPRQQFVVVR